MEPKKRTVDIHTYLPVLMELLEQGESVSLTVTGNSMSPFLVHGRDQISFQKPSAPLKRGDMAFFCRVNGDYVMHRVLRAEEDGYFLVGDGQQEVEGPVPPGQVFAVVTKVCRKGRWIGPGDFWWDFFAGPWLRLLPLHLIFALSCGVTVMTVGGARYHMPYLPIFCLCAATLIDCRGEKGMPTEQLG